MVVARTRKRKSERMKPEEVVALKKFVKSFDTKIDAFEAIGISKPTLDIVMIRETGHPQTIAKIRKAIQSFLKN